MKLISILICIASIGIPTAAPAKCPSQLTADNMHECIMMESNGNFSYREWASEFYSLVNPGKAAAIKDAYKNSAIKATRTSTTHKKPLRLSISSAR